MSLPWSFSAYSSATRCLRLYRHQFLDKTKPDYESGDMSFGSALHSAINGVLTGEDGAALFEIYWTAYKDRDLVYGRYKWPELAELGGKFARNFARLHAKRYVLNSGEQRLSAGYKGIRLDGTMDFYGLFDGRTSLRDFKTSSSNYPADKGTVALQLNLYAYIASQNGFKLPETLGFTVFSKSTGTIQQLTWEFSESVMRSALDSMVEYCTMFDSSAVQTYPKNLNSCLDFNRRCQYWSKCHPEGGTNG